MIFTIHVRLISETNLLDTRASRVTFIRSRAFYWRLYRDINIMLRVSHIGLFVGTIVPSPSGTVLRCLALICTSDSNEVRVDHDTAPRFTLPMTLCLLTRTRQNIIPRVMTITMAAKITLMGNNYSS